MGSAAVELPQFKGRAGWEFTDISELDLAAYERVAPLVSEGAPTAGAGLWELSSGARQLDDSGAAGTGEAGRRAGGWPEGVIVTSLEEASDKLGSLLSASDDVFVALNDGGERSGTFVYVPRGVTLTEPIALNVLVPAGSVLANERTLVVIEEGAQAEVWEQFLSTEDDQDAVLNVVTELIVGANARLRYVCGQDLSEKTWIFGAQRAEVGRDAALDWVALGFGSKRGRVRMETKLAGEGADARVTGAYATHGRQHIDFDTNQEHAAPNTTSDLAFRGVLQDRSTAVWKGNIIVDPGAQKTDAFQESRNLLISKRAHADSIPGLEIQANDVRCTHAAAIAQVDPEQVYYLRSHGLPELAAKRLVIEGFLAALVERFEEGPVRDVLGATLERRLSAIL